MPDNVKPDDPSDSAETLRIMANLERYADMPAWAARDWIKILAVRVERLQEISEDDAIAEGIYCWPNDGRGCQGTYGWGDTFGFATARAAYAALIDTINGPGTWESNPWVWVYEFERSYCPHPSTWLNDRRWEESDEAYIAAAVLQQACNAYPALRAELAEARKKADEYDAMMACIADEDVRLMVSKPSDENTGDMVTIERWHDVPGTWESETDVPTFAQARTFLVRKEGK